MPVQRTADIPAVLLQVERRLLLRIGIAGVERIVTVIEAHRAPKPVGAWFRQDLSSPEANGIELRRKRVLIDPDFADGALGRQHGVAGRKAIDEDLGAGRACRRSGQRRQIRLQVVGIIGEGIKGISGDHDAGSIGRFTHGTSAQRAKWFNNGLQNASVKGCDTFSARQL